MRLDSRFFTIGLKSAMFAGAVAAALACQGAPASAQQRGTGVVEGPVGGGGGGGGRDIQRPAVQAPRAASPRMMAPQAGVAQRYASPRPGVAPRYAGPQAGFAQRYRDPQAAAAQRIYPEQTYRQSVPRGRYSPRDRRRWYGPSIVTVPTPYGYDWAGAGAYDPYYDAPYDGGPVYGAPYYGGYEAYPPAYPAPVYPAPVYPGPVAVGGAQGGRCETPQKVCELYDPAPIGIGCSCRAPAGQPRFRGRVIP